jgi:predicted transglutaminase-like cysteine proteinase
MRNGIGRRVRTGLALAGAALAGVMLAGLLEIQTGEARTIAPELPAATPAEALGEARPLLAWIDFCRRYPSECVVDTAEPAAIALTPRVWQAIVSVNRKVNATLKPMTDLDHWGVADKWDLPDDGYGDCEDYQLLKRKLLVEQGLPRRAMRMTVVRDELGEGHAVLMIRTDRGDFVLDNKTSGVLSWDQTGYAYVKRESQIQVGWVSLGGATSPVATANR